MSDRTKRGTSHFSALCFVQTLMLHIHIIVISLIVLQAIHSHAAVVLTTSPPAAPGDYATITGPSSTTQWESTEGVGANTVTTTASEINISSTDSLSDCVGPCSTSRLSTTAETSTNWKATSSTENAQATIHNIEATALSSPSTTNSYASSSTNNVVSTTNNVDSTTEDSPSNTNNLVSITENAAFTTENSSPTANNVSSTTTNVASSIEYVESTTENLASTVSYGASTKKNVASTTSTVPSITKDSPFTTDNDVSTTGNTIPTTMSAPTDSATSGEQFTTDVTNLLSTTLHSASTEQYTSTTVSSTVNATVSVPPATSTTQLGVPSATSTPPTSSSYVSNTMRPSDQSPSTIVSASPMSTLYSTSKPGYLLSTEEWIAIAVAAGVAVLLLGIVLCLITTSRHTERKPTITISRDVYTQRHNTTLDRIGTGEAKWRHSLTMALESMNTHIELPMETDKEMQSFDNLAYVGESHDHETSNHDSGNLTKL